MSRLGEIKARADVATPGPWHAWDRGIGWEVHKGEECAPGCGRSCDALNGEFRDTFTRADAEFIAAAREDVPWLVSEVESLTAEREWFKDRFPCDGVCVDAPEEACSRHGRNPADLWRIIWEVTAERDALAATVARVEEVLDHWRTVDEGNAAYAERIGERSRFADGLASRADMLGAALAGSETDTTDQETGHRCEPYYSRVERLERWKAEALEVMSGLQELGKALGLGLGVQITGPAALAEVARLTAERDALAAQVARVEALGEKWLAMDEANADYFSRERLEPTLVARVATIRQERLQAALAGSETDTTDQETGHRCEPYYSRAECGQCGWQEQWCVTCSRKMCGCATDTTDQDAMGADQ